MDTSSAGPEVGDSPAPARPLGQALIWTILVLTGFNALSAIAGGVGILLSDGLGMPRSMLSGSPFESFVVPGIVLGVAIGGTQILAFLLLCIRKASALVWTAVAGFGMLIWIFVETGIIAGLSWLQVLYFATGAGQVALVLAMLGVVSWLPRPSFSGRKRVIGT